MDHVICDPPYSEHVHKNARFAVRNTPLKTTRKGRNPNALETLVAEYPVRPVSVCPRHTGTGGNRSDEAARSRAVGCRPLRCGVLSPRREALAGAGLDYVRTAFWHRLCWDAAVQRRSSGACLRGDHAGPPARSQAVERRARRGFIRSLSSKTLAAWRDAFTPQPSPLDLMLAIVTDFHRPRRDHPRSVLRIRDNRTGALRLGRNLLGAEKDAGHYATACARPLRRRSGSTLAAARAGQSPASLTLA